MDDGLKKTERLLREWILLLESPSGCSAKELSEKFDVDVRTIYRDIDALGAGLHVPIYNEKTKWKIDDEYYLPPIKFSIPEALNIFLTSRLMLGYSNRYDPNIDATFTKLSSVLPPMLSQQVNKTMSWMQTLPKNDKLIKVMATVAESWITQKQLKIDYQSILSEGANERIIDPYFIEPAAFGHSSYVIGYCHLKKSVRTFKIERITSAEITDQSYTIPKDFDANKFFQSSWGIIADGEIKTVKLKIKDRDMERLMQETIWHPSQQFDKQQDGSTIMTLQIADTCEFLSWVLGWGGRIEVLEPAELRDEVINTVGKMQKIYRLK